MNEIQKKYWEERYKSGGNSGWGSYGICAKNKANIVNNYITQYNIKTILDLGCGDGNQISLLEGFENYHGYDISEYVVDICKQKIGKKLKMSFYKEIGKLPKADMCMSLDVIYHIVDEQDFKDYLFTLFNKSKKYVLIFSTNYDDSCHEYYGDKSKIIHMYHRIFTDWVNDNIKNFTLIEEFNNLPKTTAKFFFYKKSD